MHVSPSGPPPSMEPVPATALASRPAAVAVDDGPFGVAALRARLSDEHLAALFTLLSSSER